MLYDRLILVLFETPSFDPIPGFKETYNLLLCLLCILDRPTNPNLPLRFRLHGDDDVNGIWIGRDVFQNLKAGILYPQQRSGVNMRQSLSSCLIKLDQWLA